MSPSLEPPLVTSQMPWGEATLLLCILPLSCWLFRWFAHGPMAYSMHNRHALRVGIGVASLILGVGFVSAGHALIGLLNYTRIEKEGIRQVAFLKPGKYQRWDELVSAEAWEKKAWEWGKRDRPYLQSTGFTLEFKEGGRWREFLSFSSDQFRREDFRRLQEWLEANLPFEPPEPAPFPPSLR